MNLAILYVPFLFIMFVTILRTSLILFKFFNDTFLNKGIGHK